MNDLIGEKKNPGSLEGLLLQVGSDTLLVPMTSVSEIIEERPSVSRTSSSKAWLHGWFDWRNQYIPLLAFEGLEGVGPIPLTEASQVVIFNAIGAAAERGFFALAIDGLPRPVRLSEEQELPTVPAPERNGIAFALSMEGKTLLVPDLGYLEQLSIETVADGTIA